MVEASGWRNALVEVNGRGESENGLKGGMVNCGDSLFEFPC